VSTRASVEDRPLAREQLLGGEALLAGVCAPQLLDGFVGEVAVGGALESSRGDPVDEFAGDLSQCVPARERVVRAGQSVGAG